MITHWINPERVNRALLVVSTLAIVGFWPLATVVLLQGNTPGLAICLFVMGISQGLFLAAYAFARADRKQWWRWLILVTTGAGILVFMVVDAVNLDIDGFFELLLVGIIGPAIGHTIITTLAGPLIFGRILCGWGCWRAMVLERLPFGTGTGRRHGIWGWTPLVGVAISLAVAVWLVQAPESQSGAAHGHVAGNSFWSVAAGVAVYYAASLGLALVLRDQRAFCKYLCPAGFMMRWTSRPALLHISALAEACNECGVCTDVCPMDIPLAARAKNGGRMNDGYCILCQRCVEICPTGALKTVFGR